MGGGGFKEKSLMKNMVKDICKVIMQEWGINQKDKLYLNKSKIQLMKDVKTIIYIKIMVKDIITVSKLQILRKQELNYMPWFHVSFKFPLLMQPLEMLFIKEENWCRRSINLFFLCCFLAGEKTAMRYFYCNGGGKRWVHVNFPPGE